MKVIIKLASEFSRFPGGRYRKHGPFSGEEFRQDYLVDRLREGTHVVVYLDGTVGYPSSFLEEAFGGLVRTDGFELAALKRLLTLEAGPAFKAYLKEAWEYIEEAVKATPVSS